MIVIIKSSGGYAGFEQQEVARIDTGELPQQEANRIKRLVDQVAARKDQIIGTDMMRYDIDIRDDTGDRRTMVILDDGDPGNPLRKLLDAVAAPSMR